MSNCRSIIIILQLPGATAAERRTAMSRAIQVDGDEESGDDVEEYKRPSVVGLAAKEVRAQNRQGLKAPQLFTRGSKSFNSLLAPSSGAIHYPDDGHTLDGDHLVPSSGIERIRMSMAVRIIERHYARHVRVLPNQLFKDTQRTRIAD